MTRVTGDVSAYRSRNGFEIQVTPNRDRFRSLPPTAGFEFDNEVSLRLSHINKTLNLPRKMALLTSGTVALSSQIASLTRSVESDAAKLRPWMRIWSLSCLRLYAVNHLWSPRYSTRPGPANDRSSCFALMGSEPTASQLPNALYRKFPLFFKCFTRHLPFHRVCFVLAS